MSANMKYYKLVYGFGELDYIPIKSIELHKAQYIAMFGGKANFEEGFFNNRGNDAIRIVPDWNKAMGWNMGYKLTSDDMAEIRKLGLEQKYTETLHKAKEIAEYVKKTNSLELLQEPAHIVYKNMLQLENNNLNQLHD